MSEFALLTRVQAAIEKASSIADATRGRDQAETLRAYAKLTGESLEVQNECAEVKIRYERKGGELLKAIPKPKGRPPQKADQRDQLSTYDDLGINAGQRERWGALALSETNVFEGFLASAQAEGRELTTASVLALSRGKKFAVHTSSATPEWGTPQDLFDELDAEFKFALDVCSTPELAKCKHFFAPDDDGLSQSWAGVCWMNPPYGAEIPAWVEKAHESATAGTTVVCLVPARVDTGWWWDHCRYGEIRFLRGRLKFGDADTSAPFPSAIVVFGYKPKVIWWER